MRIDIWSDVVCPWCYIGKRRLEQALADFPHPVEITWHSFQLDPGTPKAATASVVEHLGAKYGGGALAGQQMVDRMEAVAAEEGLLFRLSEAQRANTMDAHRLLHFALAEDPQQQSALKEELLASYFLRAESPADQEVLVAAATKAGLAEAAVRDVLTSDRYTADVWEDIDRASDLGATGVPFFVIDDKYAIAGAQPVAAFTQVLDRAWTAAHPPVELTGDGESCGPGMCG